MQGPSANLINGCETLAFPTIGIVLLGGVSDPIKRYPLHNSAGIAYTSEKQDILTRTRVYYSKDQSVIVNGSKLDPSDPRTPFHLLSRYAGENLSDRGKLSVFSENHGIISGSSDAGAAALARAAEEMFAVKDRSTLENDFRSISESIGRSLLGGLTVTELTRGIPHTSRLLSPEDFRNIIIVAFKFSTRRNPSDTIHKNVVTSKSYKQRIQSAAVKCQKLRELAVLKDIKGIFELAMDDTDEYHALLESVGVRVINEEMRLLINKLRERRNDFWRTYIVTGGTNVFVAAEKCNAPRLEELARSLNIPTERLVVAGASRVYIDF